MKKLASGLVAMALAASPALAGSNTFHVSGQGILNDGRVFTLNARIDKNGTVSGHATLINTGFSGDNGKGPYRAYIDISCINQVNGEIYLGGFATRTNDSNLEEAVYFAISEDGSQLSRAFFFDGDPDTTGDPGLCQFNQSGDFPLEDVIRGNINVRQTG